MVDKNGRLLAELVELKGFFLNNKLTEGKGSDSSYQQGMMNAQTAG